MFQKQLNKCYQSLKKYFKKVHLILKVSQVKILCECYILKLLKNKFLNKYKTVVYLFEPKQKNCRIK